MHQEMNGILNRRGDDVMHKTIALREMDLNAKLLNAVSGRRGGR